MPLLSKRADLLERSIQGFPCTDREVRDLVTTASRIPVLTSSASAPRDDFVTALGLRLRAEALTLPAREVRNGASPSSTQGVRRSATRPRVLVIGRLPRVLAGATASVLLIAAMVGVTSRSALPGGLLYPVKQVLDSAAVQLAGSDLDRAVTLLSQAQEDISDARALVERDRTGADPAPVSQALRSAYHAVSTGQQTLLGEFDRTLNVQTLTAVQDFTVRGLPQLNALRPLVPAASRPDVDALIALLQETRTTAARRIVVCGLPCASLADTGLGSSAPAAPSAPSARSASLSPTLKTGKHPVPSLPAVGRPKTAIVRPGAVVVNPTASDLPIPRVKKGAGVVNPPPLVKSTTIRPPATVAPPVPRLPKVPLVTPKPALPLPKTDLPGLP